MTPRQVRRAAERKARKLERKAANGSAVSSPPPEPRTLQPENISDLESLLHMVQRAMASAERSFYKALATLRQLQKDRGFVPQKTIHIAAEIGFVPQETAYPAPEIGFVSQNGTQT